jgi:hypothetical protein
MRRMKYCLLSICILLAACSMSNDREIAEKAVKEYHDRYNRRAFAEIYDNEHEELKAVRSRESFMQSIEGMRNTQGAVKSAKILNDEYSYSSDAKQIRLTYDVEFENGQAKEQFVFTILGDQAVLSGYRYISP